MKHSPVTLIVAALCIAATFIAAWTNLHRLPLTSWLVHIDAQHLGVVLITWLALGLWMEPRIGSARTALWVIAGLGISTLSHALVHPEHDRLVGLSAVAFFVFAAGFACRGLRRPWGWAGLIGIALVLAQEWRHGMSPGQEFLSTLVGNTWRFPWAGASLNPEAVPLVHIACAMAGLAFGLLAAAAHPDAAPRRTVASRMLGPRH